MLVVGLLSACSPSPGPAANTPTSIPGSTTVAASTLPPTLTATSTETTAPSDTPTPGPTQTETITPTPSPTETLTATPVPTYVTLRGKVIIDQAVCHYGPGAPYLYKYGVYKDSNLEIIRRVELGNYIEIQAIGGNNPCWMRADYLEVKGDLMNVQPVSAEDVQLPWSPYYPPLTGVSARRDGNEVTVFWNPLALRPGDDSEQSPYVVEAWVCQDGQFVFTPVGTYQTAVKIVDEPGCTETSHGRVTAAEKHGYTWRVEVSWPTFEGTP